jgi:plastocyanin
VSSRRALVVVGLGLLGWWGGSLPEPRSAQAQVVVQQPIVDFAFQPAELVVPPGTVVVWRNQGATIHTIAPADLAWSSPVLELGEQFEYAFTVPGVYPLLCTIHPDMVASVRVE